MSTIAIQDYVNNLADVNDQHICQTLYLTITAQLPEATAKVWHAHPVWFIHDNPIVGFSKQKAGIRLMFWSGADFEEKSLNIIGKKFKDASIFYNTFSEINPEDLKRWLEKSKRIQWDYKNIVKRKGMLLKIENKES